MKNKWLILGAVAVGAYFIWKKMKDSDEAASVQPMDDASARALDA